MSYTINGSDLSAYNIEVLSSSGALDIPERIGETEHNWNDSNGVEPYVASTDLEWNGREITLHGFYSGSNFLSDMAVFEAAMKGTDLTLVTPYDTHTVRLKSFEEMQIIANQKARIKLTFWEQTVTAGTAPSATGGTGVRLGGYDFYEDFGLHVSILSGFGTISNYHLRKLIYTDASVAYSGYRDPRTIKIELRGLYASIATLATKIKALKSVLMSAGTKPLIYRGVTTTVYFTAGAVVEVSYKTKTVRIILNLKVQE